MRVNDKRGTHVGVVLSFILFITFLIFLFATIQFPLKHSAKKANSLEGIEKQLIDKISEDAILVYLANTSAQSGEDCVKISEQDLPNLPANALARDITGEVIPSKREGGFTYVAWSKSQSFFKVYYSDTSLAIPPLGSCSSSADGEIRNVGETREVFESKIINLLQEYNTSYDSLKREVGITEDDEFSIQFEYSNGTILGRDVKDMETNIYGKEFDVEYISQEGENKKGELRIYLW
ncbi:hypothetical protein B6U91_01920 [Candidatus Pacearchaeota archaeon ex4484_71]|nr:MAG: hypothetical protein B6U91_01920 [Candidatus Pacearchaeota archaeon ex4484_71]